MIVVKIKIVMRASSRVKPPKIFFLTIIVIHFLSISKIVAQQDYSNKFDFKFGTGIGFMGWGDLLAVCFENESNYKINENQK
jgi:hypothetical protein